MESSRYIKLADGILVEYIYTDQANPTVFNTATYPIEIMQDGYLNNSYFFNTDSVSSIMGNYRDISVASVTANKTKFVFLNSDMGVPYNDYDSELTNSANLLQTFSPNLDIKYDKIKIHFVSGFNFIDYDGIIFEILVPRRDGVMINLSAINFLRTDTPVFNPDPFLYGDNLYSTYIEWRIPSLFYMNNEYSSSDSNGLGYRLTNGVGFLGTPSITIKAQGIYQTSVINSYSFYDVEEINSATILNRDIYDNLYANVVESSSGDYFELSGQVLGSTFSNFIATLNSTGADYIAIHEIVLSEQIGTNFVQTSSQLFMQTSDFDDPILYRPIVLNSSVAVSFAINYTLRLYNRNDNTQIVKKARLSSFNAKKYGRRIMKINLGVVPTVANVYNQLSTDDNVTISGGSSNLIQAPGQTSDQIVEKLVVKTKYVTSFRDRLNIKAAISPAKIQNITDTDDSNTN